MSFYLRKEIVLLALLYCILPINRAHCQGAMQASQDTVILRDVELDSVPAGIAIKSLARLYNVNLSAEEGLDIPLTLHLYRVSITDLFEHLRSVYPLEITYESQIWHIREKREKDQAQQLQLSWASGRLELEAKDVRLDSISTALARRSVMTLLPAQYGDRRITGYISTVQPEDGVKALLRSHGLEMSRQAPGVYITQELSEDSDQHLFELFAEGDFVTFRLRRAPVDRVLSELARVLEWDIFFYGPIEGEVTASAEYIPAARALELLLVGTGLGIRLEDQALLVGSSDLIEFSEVRLFQFKHLKVEGLIERLPENLTNALSLKVIEEQNGLLASGATSAINAVEAFIQTIDQPVAQILFETLVVDYFDEVGSEFGLDIGVGPPRDSTSTQQYFPEINAELRGSYILNKFPGFQERFPIIKHLPDDFYIRLKALEKEGKVRIRSRPQLATLNGSPATLTVGTTQYFLIRSETTFAQQTVQTRISEQFETIEASMTLNITPWVTTTGEIITQIKPEFRTPQGALNPDLPPTINHRIIDTTVRLLDGQTIILGGLVQESIHEEERKFPLLWRIPILGKLFISRVQSSSTSELMIYLTPHIYYGEEGSVIPPGAGGIR